MARVVVDILVDAIADGLKLKRDPIQLSIVDEAIARYRKCGQVIFESYMWDARKVDQYEVTPDSDGIITFASTVDLVLALRGTEAGETTSDTIIWPEDEVNAAIRGDDVSSLRFTKLSDTTAGLRRIQTQADDAFSTFRALVTKRFVPAVRSLTYSSLNPTATPTDYRVLTWPVDHADAALVAYIADELRKWDSTKPENDWEKLLAIAVNKVSNQAATDHTIFPMSPMFSDLSGFYGSESNYDHKTY